MRCDCGQPADIVMCRVCEARVNCMMRVEAVLGRRLPWPKMWMFDTTMSTAVYPRMMLVAHAHDWDVLVFNQVIYAIDTHFRMHSMPDHFIVVFKELCP